MGPLEIPKGRIPLFKRAVKEAVPGGDWETLTNGTGWHYLKGKQAYVRLYDSGAIVPEGTKSTDYRFFKELIDKLLGP